MDQLITVLDARVITGRGGGPEKTILNSPRYLEGTRYHNLVCYLRSPKDIGFAELRRRAADKVVQLIEVDDFGPLDISILWKLTKLCRRHNVRVWHGHDNKTDFLGILLKRWLGLKLVTTVHGWVQHTARTPLYYAIDRWTLPHYDQVIAVSQDLFQSCLAAGVCKRRLHLIENGIDTEEFRRTCPSEAAALRREIPKRTLVFGAMGRLSDEKGFGFLINAFAKLVNEGFDCELWIAGEGPERQNLSGLAQSTGCGSRIRLLGFQSDPRALFKAFDVFCISSVREGLPNVLLEAMAMEVPVIATRCGGIEAFGRSGEDMVLVPAGEIDPLAAAMRSLALNVQLRNQLVTAARRRVEAECSFAARMKRVIGVYDRLWS